MKIENLLSEQSPAKKVIITNYIDEGELPRVKVEKYTKAWGVGQEEIFIPKIVHIAGPYFIYPTEITLCGSGETKEEAFNMIKDDYFSHLRQLNTILFRLNFEDIQLVQSIRKDITFNTYSDIILGTCYYTEAGLSLTLITNIKQENL